MGDRSANPQGDPQCQIGTEPDVALLKCRDELLPTGLGRLQSRLAILDAYHGKVGAAAPASRKTGQANLGRKPNVRDIAVAILERTGKPMAIAVLADRVMKARGKKSGKMFAMNLGTALRKDRRFRRKARGVYALR